MAMSDVTAGDLDAEREVLLYRHTRTVHLAGAECATLGHSRATVRRRTTAGVLFGDEPVCRDCLGVDFRSAGRGEATLPTSTEVVQ